MMAMFIGHIYMGTIGTKGALDGMRTGQVDEAWAKEHHELWYNDIKAGKIPAQRSSAAGQGAPASRGRRPEHPRTIHRSHCMNFLATLVAALALTATAGTALAKLPAPSDEAKAKAAEAAAKSAHAGKVGAYQLCKVQDKVVADYLARAKAAGTAVKAPAAMPACADPGAFVAMAADAGAKK